VSIINSYHHTDIIIIILYSLSLNTC